MYNLITLSRVAEETGPMKPGNLIILMKKVPIPAEYPRDEDLILKSKSALFCADFLVLIGGNKNVKNVIYIRISNRRSSR